MPFLFTPVFHYLLILVGIILRSNHFLQNRSLWLDESWVALTILSRSFEEIIYNVNFVITDAYLPPVVFLLISKIFTEVLGNSEMVLRIVPFISSILSLFVFKKICQTFKNPKLTTLALLLFVLTDSLIYYAAELKQYSSDVLVCLIILYSFLKQNNNKYKFSLFMSVLGCVAIWSSFPSVFVLAGCGTVFILSKYLKREIDQLHVFLIPVLLWMWSFSISFSTYIVKSMNDLESSQFWENKYLPWEFFSNPMGYGISLFSLLLFITGIVSLFNKNKKVLCYIVMPLLVTFIAAIMSLYPFHGRVGLFAVPLFILIMSQGIFAISQHFKKMRFFIVLILLGGLLYKPVYDACYYLTHQRSRADTRSALEYFSKHYQPGDYIITNYLMKSTFWYYGVREGYNLTLPKEPHQISDGRDIMLHRVGLVFDDYMHADDYKGNNNLLSHQKKEGLLFTFTYYNYDEKGNYRIQLRKNKEIDQLFLINETDDLTDLVNGNVWLLLYYMDEDAQEAFVKIFDEQGQRQKIRNQDGVYIAQYAF